MAKREKWGSSGYWSLSNDSKYQLLKTFFLVYCNELEVSGVSVLLILSQMNIELSNVLVENQLQLSEEQSKLLKKLRSLSNIRYGY